jgi:hypothetical protein
MTTLSSSSSSASSLFKLLLLWLWSTGWSALVADAGLCPWKLFETRNLSSSVGHGGGGGAAPARLLVLSTVLSVPVSAVLSRTDPVTCSFCSSSGHITVSDVPSAIRYVMQQCRV